MKMFGLVNYKNEMKFIEYLFKLKTIKALVLDIQIQSVVEDVVIINCGE